MLAVPLALAIVGGYFWLAGGRYVSTDNAYVQQDKVTIVPEIEGRIVEIGGVENEHVEKGHLLFRLDDAQYQVAVQQAEAEVASARLDVERLKAAYAKALSDQEAAAESLRFAQETFDRPDALQTRGVVAQSGLDQARMNRQTAEAGTRGAEQAVLGAKAALAGDPAIPTDQHPAVMQALAKAAKAKLDLEHTRVTAPADGVISQTDRLQVGEYVTSDSGVMSMVETDRSWIEANFKETELTYMRAGQSVSVDIDTYPGDEFGGTVESVGAGTGAEFSLLPAQNATGNWVKVVQRIPVRIAITAKGNVPELRAGMSAHITVDTGHATLFGVVLGALTPGAIAHAHPAGSTSTE
jgi:membrane fusion protein (multidrug efflux system)